MPPGEIIFLAGGTGINPFCDVIDLLFKEMLVANNNIHSLDIVQKNPIINQRPLINRFKFVLYLSIREAGELHDLTVYQLHELSRAQVFETFIRIDSSPDDFYRAYPSFKKINKYFSTYILEMSARADKISQIYVCGPPVLSKNVVTSLRDNKIPSSKYRVLWSW